MTRQAEQPSLELEQHLHFQQVLFVVRAIGMVVLLIGLVAALAGVFGVSGPLAQALARSGALQVQFPRFSRYQAPARLVFEVDTAATTGDTFELVFTGEHASQFSFEHILPQPTEVAVADDRVHYTFQVAPGERQSIVMQGQPETVGRLSGTVSLAGGTPLRIDSFVYP